MYVIKPSWLVLCANSSACSARSRAGYRTATRTIRLFRANPVQCKLAFALAGMDPLLPSFSYGLMIVPVTSKGGVRHLIGQCRWNFCRNAHEYSMPGIPVAQLRRTEIALTPSAAVLRRYAGRFV